MKYALIFSLLMFMMPSFNKKDKKWIAIGDSITYLNDHTDETGKRISSGYMTRVVKKMPGMHYINQGHNGWTAGGIAEHIDSLGIEKADLYSIFLGTNDWWQGRPLGSITDYVNNTGNNTVYGSFRIITNKIRELNKNALIVFITPMQRGDFVYFNDFKNNAYGSYRAKNEQTLEQFAKAVKEIGDYEHAPVVDLYHKKELDITQLVAYKRLKDPHLGTYRNYPYPDYIDIPFDPASDEYPYPATAIKMTYDGLHPSDKGYAVIADMLVNVFSKKLYRK